MKRILPLIVSALGVLPLKADPVITQQPTNQTVWQGSPAVFSVAVSGTGPFTYQWQFNGSNLPNNIITTVAGDGTNDFSGDGGPAVEASLNQPNNVLMDAAGDLLIADRLNNRIRRVDTNGIITTMAGTGTRGFSGDGGAVTNAAFYQPNSISFDALGNLYIADTDNCRIRKLDTNGVVWTVAGNGAAGYSGDNGKATNASLQYPVGVVADAVGNLFIADTGNHRIRKVDTNGIITTIAGIGIPGFTGDGGAAEGARMAYPTGVALDAKGNLYIADQFNNRIRKVDTNGIITTVAGDGPSGRGRYSGDGGAATNAGLFSPKGVAVDAVGDLFIADFDNNRIRKVDTNGIITTVAGSGDSAYTGDDGAATNAGLLYPLHMTVGALGNLFISDSSHNVIREVHFTGLPYMPLPHAGLADAGNYAVVITGPDGSVTSSVVNLTVLIPPENFTAQTTANGLQLQFTGTTNYPYILQSATNLTPPVNWQPIFTNPADASGNWQFTDTNLAAEQKFYRAVGQKSE